MAGFLDPVKNDLRKRKVTVLCFQVINGITGIDSNSGSRLRRTPLTMLALDDPHLAVLLIELNAAVGRALGAQPHDFLLYLRRQAPFLRMIYGLGIDLSRAEPLELVVALRIGALSQYRCRHSRVVGCGK